MSRARSTTQGRAPRRAQWGALQPEWDDVFIPDPPARPDDTEDREPEGERFTTADGRTLRRVVIEP